MMKLVALAALPVLSEAKKNTCTLPSGTEAADDGNPHCWDRARRCDGPNAHKDGDGGYSPSCGACEGIGGPAFGDKNSQIVLPKCTPLPPPGANDIAPVQPEWATMGNFSKFTVESDRFIMIGKMTDPFCFAFFPSNNSIGKQCYRKQTGKLTVDMSPDVKTIRYDLNLHIPWPSDKYSLFGNISTKIIHNGPNMWVVNNLYNLMDQCVCTQPLSSDGHGGHNMNPIYPVQWNWTNNLKWLARERLEVEYGFGEVDVDHFVFGPHHAWAPVGSNKLLRMWQPYNGFEVFDPAGIKPDYADASLFKDMTPPAVCKKGGALARITCTDDGYPSKYNNTEEAFARPAEPADVRRSRTKVPSRAHRGSNFFHMATTLNSLLRKGYPEAKECAEWSDEELKKFQLMMLLLRSNELNDVYSSSEDGRAMRGDEHEHGARWEKLSEMATGMWADVHRDGHCHEAVMWFVHHVSETTRNAIAQRMAIPLLPYTRHECDSKHEVCDEYLKQVTCQDCHQDVEPGDMTV